MIRPTSPLRPSGLIERAAKILSQNPDCSSVRTVAPVKEHPYRVWRLSGTGTLLPAINGVDEPYNLPRQVLPQYFFQTGDIEVVRRETLLLGSVSGDNVHPLVIDHEEMVDIDSFDDLLCSVRKTKYVKILICGVGSIGPKFK